MNFVTATHSHTETDNTKKVIWRNWQRSLPWMERGYGFFGEDDTINP